MIEENGIVIVYGVYFMKFDPSAQEWYEDISTLELYLTRPFAKRRLEEMKTEIPEGAKWNLCFAKYEVKW